jgi:hypothetical protein
MRNADYVMHNVFWLGVYPGLTAQHIDYVLEVLHDLARTGAAPPPRVTTVDSGDPE